MITPIKLGLISDPPAFVLLYKITNNTNGDVKKRKRKIPLRNFSDTTNINKYLHGFVRPRHLEFLEPVPDEVLCKLLRVIQLVQKGRSVGTAVILVDEEFAPPSDKSSTDKKELLLTPAGAADKSGEEEFEKNKENELSSENHGKEPGPGEFEEYEVSYNESLSSRKYLLNTENHENDKEDGDDNDNDNDKNEFLDDKSISFSISLSKKKGGDDNSTKHKLKTSSLVETTATTKVFNENLKQSESESEEVEKELDTDNDDEDIANILPFFDITKANIKKSFETNTSIKETNFDEIISISSDNNKGESKPRNYNQFNLFLPKTRNLRGLSSSATKGQSASNSSTDNNANVNIRSLVRNALRSTSKSSEEEISSNIAAKSLLNPPQLPEKSLPSIKNDPKPTTSPSFWSSFKTSQDDYIDQLPDSIKNSKTRLFEFNTQSKKSDDDDSSDSWSHSLKSNGSNTKESSQAGKLKSENNETSSVNEKNSVDGSSLLLKTATEQQYNKRQQNINEKEPIESEESKLFSSSKLRNVEQLEPDFDTLAGISEEKMETFNASIEDEDDGFW